MTTFPFSTEEEAYRRFKRRMERMDAMFRAFRRKHFLLNDEEALRRWQHANTSSSTQYMVQRERFLNLEV